MTKVYSIKTGKEIKQQEGPSSNHQRKKYLADNHNKLYTAVASERFRKAQSDYNKHLTDMMENISND